MAYVFITHDRGWNLVLWYFGLWVISLSSNLQSFNFLKWLPLTRVDPMVSMNPGTKSMV
jgi:hypothetical protein